MSATQLELLYRKVVVIYPASAAVSARRPIRARVDDGLDYMLKDHSGGVPVRAREWICHSLADIAGLPVLEYRPILAAADRVLFGSRFLLHGGPGGATGYKILAGTLPLAEVRTVLSALYAVDLFLGNWDRHADNLMIEHDAAPRIRVMDFSEAPALIDPAQRGKIPGAGTATLRAGRTLRGLYGFDQNAAELALKRLDAVPSGRVKEILDGMPADWLSVAAKEGLLNWWGSPDRPALTTKICTGMADGSLL
jgi:hypothetical protein